MKVKQFCYIARKLSMIERKANLHCEMHQYSEQLNNFTRDCIQKNLGYI